MFKLCTRFTLCISLLQLLPAFASMKGNDACQALVAEGHSLFGQGKLREAADAFNRAHKADPAASEPISALANLLVDAATHAPADRVAGLRKQAQLAAREALRLNSQDPLAQEILRGLEDDFATPLHSPAQAAALALNEGEALFMQRRYTEALAKYELAAARDPQLSAAWVYAGDCFYARQQWHEAETRFRRATEIEPLNGQAWRFLSDALAKQGQHEAAEAALVGGIAAAPNQLPNWDKLELLMRGDGTPLKRLHLIRRGGATVDPATGKKVIGLDASSMKEAADMAVWLLIGASETIDKKDPGYTPSSAFLTELKAWRTAMQMVNAGDARGERTLADPALITMQQLANAGQLEPAILLLMYREPYRPDFEAWKRAHPDGIAAFIATWRLRP